MTRTIKRNLLLGALFTAILALACLYDPLAVLLAGPVIFGIAEGDDNDEPDAGDEAPDAAPDDDDDGGEDGDDPDPNAGKPKKAAEPMIPAYRLREVQERFERQLQHESGKNRELLDRLAKAIGGQPADGRRAPDLTPQQTKLRTEFLKLFPEFAELLEVAPRSKDLLGLADRAPEWERDNDQFWGRVAASTSTKLYTHTAKELGLKTLDEETKAIVRDGFISWVKADKTNGRNHRYEGQDESLITDFWTFFSGRFRTPVARHANADALRRAVSTRALPRGGNSSTQVPPPPKRKAKSSGDPFEDVNDRAWAQLQDEEAATR